MSEFDTHVIRATAMELPPAIEEAFSRAIPPAPRSGEPTFLLGFDAEASDLAGLVEATFYRLTSLLADHGAGAIACMVNGLHGTDAGHRIWGTLECAIDAGPPPSTRVDSVRVGQSGEGQWEVAFRITQGLDHDLLDRRRHH